MGQARRPQPARLGPKLRQIRKSLGFSQEQMAERLKHMKSPPQPGHISEIERGKREPSLLVLVAYARLSGALVDELVDDERDLPEKLQSGVKREGIRRKPVSKTIYNTTSRKR
jgi:transcriptional regulator with XRE-family HTH domain